MTLLPARDRVQAAGTAAALAVSQGVEPRGVDIGALQAALLAQRVHLRPGAMAAEPASATAQAA